VNFSQLHPEKNFDESGAARVKVILSTIVEERNLRTKYSSWFAANEARTPPRAGV
jgi:hypothetical protein